MIDERYSRTTSERACAAPRSHRNPYVSRCLLPVGHDGPHQWAATDSSSAAARARLRQSPRTDGGVPLVKDDQASVYEKHEVGDWQPLALEDCMRLLRESHVGRIAVVIDGFPEVLPVNFRLVETGGVTWIVLGTRRGHVIARASMNVAFEIDDVEPTGPDTWSVLVRGTLHHVDAEAADFRQRFDPDPWPGAERDVWLAVQPFAISGRRLTTAATVAA